MQLPKIITIGLAVVITFIGIPPKISAAADSAWVGGDLKVDGLWFSGDESKTVIRKPSDFYVPWTILGSDIYYLPGNVGIGTMTPSAQLEINGTVKSTMFTGDGTGLTNVTASTVIDGSITDSKITGVISSAKLDLSGVQKRYGKVAIVAKDGGDYSDPVIAMNDINQWCGTPTKSNYCLLKIMPGIYDIDSRTLVMRPYTDIEGAGQGVTIVTGVVNDVTSLLSYGVVNGSNYSEIRSLTINNTSTANVSAGIVNYYCSPRIIDISINVKGIGLYQSIGIFNNYQSAPSISRVTISVLGGSDSNIGIYNNQSSPTMNHVSSTAQGGNLSIGILNSLSSPSMSEIQTNAWLGTTNNFGIANDSSSPNMSNVTAKASGSGAINYGIRNKIGSPNLDGVRASASGGVENYGLANLQSSPSMFNVIATASGTNSNNVGISNSTSSSPVMNNVTANASGGTNSTGILNTSSAPTMINVNATGINGTTTNYGMINSAASGSYTINIDHSIFTGATNSIQSDVPFTLQIGGSKLVGGGINGVGTFLCAGVYNGSYSMLSTACQ